MKRTISFFVLVLSLLCQSLATENKNIITGKIIDTETKQVISNAEIFISGSSIGTISGLDGRFTLDAPYIPCEIIVMHLSYQLKVVHINTRDNIVIELNLHQHKVNEVSISAKNKRKRNLRLFYKYFLWNIDANQIEILNDSVLHFTRTDKDLHCSCDIPLIVRNNHLGYEIAMKIDDFHIYKKDKSKDKKVKLNSAVGMNIVKLKCNNYYREIVINNEKEKNRIINNRRKHYLGSIRHFLASLYTQQLKANGFILDNVSDSTTQALELVCEKDSLKRYRFLSNEIQVTYFTNENNEPINLENKFVHYRYAKSRLISQKFDFYIWPNGTSPDLPFELYGDMAKKSPVNSLPDNYKP